LPGLKQRLPAPTAPWPVAILFGASPAYCAISELDFVVGRGNVERDVDPAFLLLQPELLHRVRTSVPFFRFMPSFLPPSVHA
jgi:hypothetical protein